MTPPPAVINTNVVISGLVGRESGSPTTVILDAMLGGLFTYLLSLDVLAEYHEVLLRPAIRRRHGLTDAEVDVVLTELALNGTLLDAAPSAAALPDDGDRHLWALLEATAAAVLVTGDDVLRRRAPDPTRVAFAAVPAGASSPTGQELLGLKGQGGDTGCGRASRSEVRAGSTREGALTGACGGDEWSILTRPVRRKRRDGDE